MLAAGIQLGGFNAWGWRLAPLLAGALVVAATCFLGTRLTGRRLGGLVAGTAVLCDGISVVTGRVALLDGLLAFWTTLVLFPLLLLASAPHQVAKVHRSKLVLGVLLGLAIATKWSALPLVLVAGVLALRADMNWTPPGARVRAGIRSLLALGLLPLVIYGAAHAGYFFKYENTSASFSSCETTASCEASPMDRLDSWWDTQWKAQDFHRNLVPSHPDVANGWHWVAQTAPVELFAKNCTATAAQPPAALGDQLCDGSEHTTRVLAVGNPLIWLVGSAAALAAMVRWARTRNAVDGLLLSVLFSFWLPWLVGGRPGFSFYGAPLVPVLGLLVARALVGPQQPGRRRTAALLVVLWAATAAFLWPIWTGAPITNSHNNLLPY